MVRRGYPKVFRLIVDRFFRRRENAGEGRAGLCRSCGRHDRRIQGMLLVTMVVVAFSACERKQVSIPPEYASSVTSPPPFYSAPQPAEPATRQAEPVAKAPEIKTEKAPASTSYAATPGQKRLVAQQAPKPANSRQAEKSKKQEAAKSPQREASMQKVNLAKGQLERGKADAAIRTLEGAIRIDTGNGEAFILLARAWKQKGEKRKALEFAKKAELLYQKQPVKLREVFLLESDLYRELGDSVKAVALRQKARGVRQKTPE